MTDIMNALQGKQVEMWSGKFGDAYQDRNRPVVDARKLLWHDIFTAMSARDIESVLEVGGGAGQNLIALKALYPALELSAIDPNAKACELLRGVIDPVNVRQCTADNMPFGSNSADMAFTSGVLIHVPPTALFHACAEIFRVSRRYIVCIEYFADEPEMKVYRGEAHKMWKRDYGKFWLDHFDLKLIDYGFKWKPATGLDNLTWWAFRKW